MGRFLNPDNGAFSEAVNSEIYIDKTRLLEYTNQVINTTSKLLDEFSNRYCMCHDL